MSSSGHLWELDGTKTGRSYPGMRGEAFYNLRNFVWIIFMASKSVALVLFFKCHYFFVSIYFLLCSWRRHGKVRDSDEENDPDDEDAVVNAVGCLGPFSGLLVPELQKFQKQMKGKEVALHLGGHRVLVHCIKGIIIMSHGYLRNALDWSPLWKSMSKIPSLLLCHWVGPLSRMYCVCKTQLFFFLVSFASPSCFSTSYAQFLSTEPSI